MMRNMCSFKNGTESGGKIIRAIKQMWGTY